MPGYRSAWWAVAAMLGSVAALAAMLVVFSLAAAAAAPLSMVVWHVLWTGVVGTAAGVLLAPGSVRVWRRLPSAAWLGAVPVAAVGDLQFLLYVLALAWLSPVLAVLLFSLYPVWIILLAAAVPWFAAQRRLGLGSLRLWLGFGLCLVCLAVVLVGESGTFVAGAAVPGRWGWGLVVGAAAGLAVALQVNVNRALAGALRGARSCGFRRFLGSELLAFGLCKLFAAAVAWGLVWLWLPVLPGYAGYALVSALCSVAGSMLLRCGLQLHPGYAVGAISYLLPAVTVVLLAALGLAGPLASWGWVAVGLGGLVLTNVWLAAPAGAWCRWRSPRSI